MTVLALTLETLEVLEAFNGIGELPIGSTDLQASIDWLTEHDLVERVDGVTQISAKGLLRLDLEERLVPWTL